MEFIKVKFVVFVMVVATSLQSSDSKYLGLSPMSSSNSFNESFGLSPDRSSSATDEFVAIPATPVAKKPEFVFGSVEEIAAYEQAVQDREAYRKVQNEKNQKIAALRRAWVIKHPHVGCSEQSVKDYFDKKTAQEVTDNQKTAACCVACLLPLIILSGADSQGCFSMSCPAKTKMA